LNYLLLIARSLACTSFACYTTCGRVDNGFVSPAESNNQTFKESVCSKHDRNTYTII